MVNNKFSSALIDLPSASVYCWHNKLFLAHPTRGGVSNCNANSGKHREQLSVNYTRRGFYVCKFIFKS